MQVSHHNQSQATNHNRPVTETSQYKIEQSINEFMNYGQKMTTFGDDLDSVSQTVLNQSQTHHHPRPNQLDDTLAQAVLSHSTANTQSQVKIKKHAKTFEQRQANFDPAGLRTSRSVSKSVEKIRIPQKRKSIPRQELKTNQSFHSKGSRKSKISIKSKHNPVVYTTNYKSKHQKSERGDTMFADEPSRLSHRSYRSQKSQKSVHSRKSKAASRLRDSKSFHSRCSAAASNKSDGTPDARKLVSENERLRERLKAVTAANGELHNEISRLRNKLTGAEKVYKKYQGIKVNFGKILSQLEKSEMQRRHLGEDLKGMQKQVHKLKKEKRRLQEECARNFGASSRFHGLNLKKLHSNADDALS